MNKKAAILIKYIPAISLLLVGIALWIVFSNFALGSLQSNGTLIKTDAETNILEVKNAGKYNIFYEYEGKPKLHTTVHFSFSDKVTGKTASSLLSGGNSHYNILNTSGGVVAFVEFTSPGTYTVAHDYSEEIPLDFRIHMGLFWGSTLYQYIAILLLLIFLAAAIILAAVQTRKLFLNQKLKAFEDTEDQAATQIAIPRFISKDVDVNSSDTVSSKAVKLPSTPRAKKRQYKFDEKFEPASRLALINTAEKAVDCAINDDNSAECKVLLADPTPQNVKERPAVIATSPANKSKSATIATKPEIDVNPETKENVDKSNKNTSISSPKPKSNSSYPKKKSSSKKKKNKKR